MLRNILLSRLRLTFLMILSLILNACSGGQPNNEARTVIVGGQKISWINFSKVSKMHQAAFSFGPGESLYMFSTASSATVTMSNGDVVEPGGCIKAAGRVSKPPVFNTAFYKECEAKVDALRKRTPRVSRGKLITLAQKAVEADGSCRWQGFDPALDTRARALGGLARSNDNRLFFAKMQCS